MTPVIKSMTDIRQWLSSINLVQYADAFEENAIEWELLEELTDDDLRTIGVAALGHRKRMLIVISEFGPRIGDCDPTWAPRFSGPVHSS